MKNAEVLRMAEALLTPAVTITSSSSSSSSSDQPDEAPEQGDNTIDQLSLINVSMPLNGASNVAASTTTVVTVAVDDPQIKERLRILLETTVRLLYPKGLLAGEKLPAPAYPLVGEGNFPLPDSLAAAAAYHTAWLLTGEPKLSAAYEAAMEIYYSSLESFIAPIVRKH